MPCEDVHDREGSQQQQSMKSERDDRVGLKRSREADEEGETRTRGGPDSLEQLGEGNVLTMFLALQAEMTSIVAQRRKRMEEERRKSLEIAEAHPISFLPEEERLRVLRANMPEQPKSYSSGANSPRHLDRMPCPQPSSLKALAPAPIRLMSSKSMDGMAHTGSCSSTQPSAAIVVVGTAVEGST